MKKMSNGIFLFLLLISFQSNVYASGDPAVIYYFGGGLILQLVAFFLLIYHAERSKLVTAVVYLSFFGLVWYWAWNNHSVTLTTVGVVLIVLPIVIATGRLILVFRKR